MSKIIFFLSILSILVFHSPLVSAVTYPEVNANKANQVAVDITGRVSMICDDSVMLVSPSGKGNTSSAVACSVTTNGSSGYTIDATTSAQLTHTSLATASGIARLGGTAGTPFSSPVTLDDNTHDAWGLYHSEVGANISCSSIVLQDFDQPLWGSTGVLVNQPLNVDSSVLSHKFCVAAGLNTTVESGLYTGAITFTATSID